MSYVRMGLLAWGMVWGVGVQGVGLHSKAIRLRFEGGVPAALENRWTGEVMTLEASPATSALLWQGRVVTPSAPLELLPRPSVGEFGVRFAGEDASFCETRYAISGDDTIVLTQRGRSNRPGLYGVQWGLAGLNAAEVTVIVPAMSGVAFGKGRMPFTSLSFSWPVTWEAGMVLLQMKQGGFVIWADDPDMHFKMLRLQRRGERFTLHFQSHNYAPFDASRTVASFPWRIQAYAGDWRSGAEIYRRWLAQSRAPTPLAQRQPAWAGDIRSVIILSVHQKGLLASLATHVVPSRTLLYVPDWRRDRYDKNYPDYTANTFLAPFVTEAHRLGFKVMPHVNYFGCDLRHPLYQRFKAVQLRTPHTDALEWWTPPMQKDDESESSIKFAYIHPGSAAWRRVLVQAFSRLVEEYHVDALHLDQTLWIPNHNRGRVDGMTVPEGNLQLHRDLRAALPAVALSGEGLNEVTLPYEAFAQRHAPRAVDHVHGTWSEAFLRCGHPISSYLFLPYTTLYGYLGMSNPAAGDLYGAWKRAYEPWGVVPTFSHPFAAQLERPNASLALLLEEMSLWTRHVLRADFGGVWGPDIRFKDVAADGVRVLIERQAAGGSLCRLEGTAGARDLYRFVIGVSHLSSQGLLQDWPAYNAEELIGLDPTQVYLVTDGKRPAGESHVSRVPAGIVVTGFRRHAGLFAVEFSEASTEAFFDGCDPSVSVRTGLMVQGREEPLDRGGTWEIGWNICSGVRRRSILAHPPWRGSPAGPGVERGETFAEWTVDLPDDRDAELAFAIGLRDGVRGRSDGVTFRVFINEREVFKRHWNQSIWEDHVIDLSAYRGQKIRVRWVTGPGPNQDVSFDWALWGEPVVRLKPKSTVHEFEFVLPSEPTAILGSAKGMRLVTSGERAGMWWGRVSSPTPATLNMVSGEAVPVKLPVNLATVPFHHSATVNGRGVRLPIKYCAFARGHGVSGGETKAGFAAHPPDHGRTYADFFLRLPEAPVLTLSFAVAIQDGADASGCAFVVQVNGAECSRTQVEEADGWHPVRVDLTPYAGKSLLLTLAVDAMGTYVCDWARWGDVMITAGTP